jgi:Na+/H+ antiporter NhaD/arsenite permease-like protein
LSEKCPEIESRRGGRLIAAAVLVLLTLAAVFASDAVPSARAETITPGTLWVLPFAILLLCIAILPLIARLSHWWERNRNKLIVSLALAAAACGYYALRGYGFAGSTPGMPAIARVLHHAIIGDYIPFIILLFSLYTISGGIRLTGDIPAHPLTNCAFLLLGALLASLIGTTGASMLLIRPVLQINSERKHVKHTVIFFIFLVSNIGGSLLPVGDPPLFLGYLRGVPFLWTLHLWPMWALATGLLLVVYYVYDSIIYRQEPPECLRLDETRRYGFRLAGRRNFALLAGVILAVGLLVPGQRFAGTNWVVPDLYLREIAQLVLAGISFAITPRRIHVENHFNFFAIGEVACLFIGIFITMQIPIEILKLRGDTLGITAPIQFFWASGGLSSFLDNAPTYVVFFELAGSLHPANLAVLAPVATATGQIAMQHVLAISCGAVFMGANTYIGNGPNFLVKSIAEHHGIRMPSFFGYMLYSGLILIPTFAILSLIFFL